MLTIVVTILGTRVVVSGTSFVLGLVCNADSEVGSLDVSFFIEEVIVVLMTSDSVVTAVTVGFSPQVLRLVEVLILVVDMIILELC